MSRLPRIASYVGLSTGLVLLLYSCSIERDRVHDGSQDASRARFIVLLAGCVVVAASLGSVCVSDVMRFFGDDSAGSGDPAPAEDSAEAGPPPAMQDVEVLRKKDPLEAIRVLRDLSNETPGEEHYMMRIAEIYEKDLRNPLAAALEYEELLKTKLESERWGRTAIHLTNLYIRLQEQDKAIALLRRIDRECPGTAAALKARKRLEQVDG